QAIAMHSERFAGAVNFDYGAIGGPFKNEWVAVSVIRLGVDGIRDTRDALLDYGLDGRPNTKDFGENNNRLDEGERLDPSRIKSFNSSEIAVMLSYSRMKSEKFSYGGNIKLIRKTLGDNSANGIGFDLGIRSNPVKNLFLGINFQDLTSTLVAWDTGRRELITPTLKLGLAYLFDLPILSGVMLPSFDLHSNFDGRRSLSSDLSIGQASLTLLFGVEFTIKDKLAFRIGSSDVEDLTAGVGIIFDRGYIDYSFGSFGVNSTLGNTHRISVTLNFETRKTAS
ncbi:MAG: hypothetical protein ACE5QV_05800, partial [Fidelibacterota bacterium]